MKKRVFPKLPWNQKMSRLILLMKCSLLLVFATVLQVAAKEVSSQETLTVNFNNVKLRKALKEIEHKTDYRFVFSSMIMKDEFKVTINEKNIAVNELLKRALAGTGLMFNETENKLVIIKSIETNLSAAIPVKGKILNNNGEPLAGVTIKSGKNVTVSDAEGNFSIDADRGATIEFSYVGYATQTIKVGAQTSIDIVMQAAENKLDEVVVVGYNTQSRRNLTSAVATVSGEDINKRVQTNPAALLQGQLPGLQVVQNSGEPGNEGVSLLIRGVGTFSGAGTNPLIIVDGLPGSLTVLNPNDIESVTVLKDAASAAIYGSRGANGVIVIKTKKGKANGGFSLNYSYNLGIARATALPDIVTNSATFMELSNEARLNSALQPLYTQEQIDLYKNATDRVKYPNHNWLNDVFRSAPIQMHYLNMTGGSEKTNYSLGIGYNNQDGIMIGFNEKKYTMDFGLSSRVNKRITIGTNIQMRYSHRLAPENGGTDMFLLPNRRCILRVPPTDSGSKKLIQMSSIIKT